MIAAIVSYQEWVEDGVSATSFEQRRSTELAAAHVYLHLAWSLVPM